MMKQPDWGMGTSYFLLKIQHGGEKLWIEKEKPGSFNDLFLISSLVIVFLNLTNIGGNTLFVAT